MFKRAIFRLYMLYKTYFPINRGKSFLARKLSQFFGSFVVKTKDNIALNILIDSSMDLSYFDVVNESHDRVKEEIQKLKSGDTFVDIGANIGYFVFNAAKQVGQSGRVFAFEPSIREFSRLSRMISANQVNNVIPINLAASDSSGIANLVVSRTHTGLNNLSDVKTDNDDFQPTLAHRADTLLPDDLNIDLMKIDVEGLEFKVLKGLEKLLANRRIKKIVIEITDAFLQKCGSSKAELYAYLAQFDLHPKYNETVWQFDELFELKT